MSDVSFSVSLNEHAIGEDFKAKIDVEIECCECFTVHFKFIEQSDFLIL